MWLVPAPSGSEEPSGVFHSNADDRDLQNLFMCTVQGIPEVILIIWLQALAVPNFTGRAEY